MDDPVVSGIGESNGELRGDTSIGWALTPSLNASFLRQSTSLGRIACDSSRASNAHRSMDFSMYDTVLKR